MATKAVRIARSPRAQRRLDSGWRAAYLRACRQDDSVSDGVILSLSGGRQILRALTLTSAAKFHPLPDGRGSLSRLDSVNLNATKPPDLPRTPRRPLVTPPPLGPVRP